MEGGCCIARYATGGEASKFERIMLGFRPIAPKPVSCGSSSGRSSPERKDRCVRRSTGRGRRRRPDKKTEPSVGRKRQRKSYENEIGAAGVVTLPLLPEPEIRPVPTTWLSFQTTTEQEAVKRVVETWVTVESVTERWRVEAGGLDDIGSTDEEKRIVLAGDSCPGLISDGSGRVIWSNRKFREMVGTAEDEEVAVWLVVATEATTASSFTCRVRVQYRRGSLTLPCDVWRMDAGGFAWRLDVHAALSLGPR